MTLHFPDAVQAPPAATSTGLAPRTAALLAYSGWWITGLMFLIVERDDRFVRFHAAQAVAAFGTIALLIAAFGALAAASLSFRPGASVPFLWAGGLTWMLGMMLWGVAMWKAASGKVWRLPLAASLADRMIRASGPSSA